ncbi:MAG: glycoside hydrolase family 1 protein [Solobacterium sp.]|nr:glycoside hydrolase family 1 protein [Solobacterium sp.]
MKEGFFWGNSVSSMQTEGGWNEDGKSLSVYDIVEPAEHRSDWHFANDNYHEYETDLDLMKDLGMNMYRFQVSWSRCVKDGCGEFNEAGLAYYDRFIDALIARGIEPMICLYHFDMPLYLAETENGFLSKKTVEYFLRFARCVIDRYSDRVHWWITFNEQNLYCQPRTAFRISGYTRGERTTEELYRIAHNVMYAHCAVCNYIHEKTDAKIGGMLAYSEVYPRTCSPKDILAASAWDEFINTDLLDTFAFGHRSPQVERFIRTHGIDTGETEEERNVIASHKEDFLSFSYYASNTISAEKIPADAPVNDWLDHGAVNNPYIQATEWNWQIDPDGFRDVLNKMYRRYRMPVFPIENGIGVQEEWDGIHTIEDDYRIEYHRDHIRAMQAAVEEDGVDVLGYLGWGLIDILSSQGDMRKRYGVVYVNRTNHDLRDMKRVPKKSYAWLKAVIHSNGEIL